MSKLRFCVKRQVLCCGMAVTFLALLLLTGCGKNPQKALIGQWVMVETSAPADSVGEEVDDMMEFLEDGNGSSEVHNVKNTGSLTKKFTWKISPDKQLIIVSDSAAKTYSIAELSKSMLILEHDIPNVGKVRTKYLTRGTKFELQIDANPADGGTVSPSGKVKDNVGTKVEVTAAAAEGYVFAGWSGASTDTDTFVTVTIKSNQTLTANFQKFFTDTRDNKKYRAVKIGNLTWMTQDLNFETHHHNTWCYQNHNANCVKYGRLYTWDAAMKACPKGWRLPVNEDWDNLTKAVGGQRQQQQIKGGDIYYWSAAGKKLKSRTGWDGWQCNKEPEEGTDKAGEDCKKGGEESGNGTDEFGFAALPGGYRVTGGAFFSAGSIGLWWSATENDASNAWSRSMYSDASDVNELYYGKSVGLSVRCVQ